MPLLFWIMDGLAAGWLTGKIMSSEGRDQVMDIVMGVAGAVAGGFLFSATHLLVQGMMIYTTLAAILGAVVLTVLSRYASGRREYGSTNQMRLQKTIYITGSGLQRRSEMRFPVIPDAFDGE